ncbi:hypothetical protein E4P41_11490 [Geodermatophilus sp. DF01-2]|nr:hypothetical protein E4P41_11490 [Geodermatophilus sp. DF01_2]
MGKVRRAPEWLVTLGVGVLAAVIGVIPQWRGTFFYYGGDNVESFIPLWHQVGAALRQGQWPGFDPGAWTGGNLVGEAAYGVLNPVTLGNAVLISWFDNLSLAAFTVMVEFLALIAMGTYLLAREYGARRAPAVIVATAIPVAGFTLWYEAAGWPSGLMAFTWVTWFWWSARAHARGRLIPLVPFLFGGLAMTTGNPYAALGLVVVLLAIGVELLAQRRFARLAHLTIMGACVGVVALLVFLPLLGTGSVSARQQLADVVNDAFLVPDLGDLAAASSPTYLPSIFNWEGQQLERVPSTYFAWFVLPLVPWLRWETLRRRAGSLISLGVVAGLYGLATLGPSNLWLFRWPLRLIEYLYLALAVLFAVTLSAGLRTDHLGRRILASGAIVALGYYLSWAVQPADINGVHVIGLVGVAAFVALAVTAWFRWGMAALGAAVVAGTVAAVFFQTTVFPVERAIGSPHVVSRMAEGTAEYEGTVLQLAARSDTTLDQTEDGEILFGNLPRAMGVRNVGNYTGIGFLEFSNELCMDYRGATCPEAFDRLWEPAGGGVQVPLIDAMRVSTLVIQRSLLPEAARGTPPEGWRVAERSAVRTVWVREQPLAGEGRVSGTSPGIEVLEDSSSSHRASVRYRADDDGRLLFARLAWPGYTATVDGRAVDVVDGPAGLLAVDVPAGEHTVLLEYRSPGLRTGALAALAASVVILVQSVVWVWRRRAGRAVGRP